MSRCALPLLVALAAPAAATETASPIAKVLSMLGDLQAKIIAEGEAVQNVFAESAEFCGDRSKQLVHEIQTGESQVGSLQAAIGEHEATITSKTTKVGELAAAIATNEKDLAEATAIREKESKDFSAQDHELVETIDMISRATGVIQREMSKGGAALVQLQSADSLLQAFNVMVQASLIAGGDAAKLTAFVQQASEDEDPGAPAAAVYESKSGGVVDALQGMQDKAEAQLEDARKKETDAKHQFEMVEQSLKDEVKFATKEMDEAKQEISAATEKKSTAEGDLQATSAELAADQQAKEELQQSCMTKAQDFQTETKSRGEELDALTKAKEIIEEATSGASFAQVSFTQTGLRVSADGQEAVRLIRGLARRQHSKELALLATRLASVARHGGRGRGVFDKIKSMVSDMITRLENEGAEAATKKAYCDKELSETSTKKEDRTDKVANFATKIEAATAKAAQLESEITELQTQLGSLLQGQAEMDKLRSEEKAVFEESQAELEKGLEGLRKALTVLKDYYAQAPALLQEDGGHTKQDGAAGGIVALLEVCESDFAKNLAEITSEEETAVAAYEKQSQENQIEKVAKEGDIKYKTKERKGLLATSAELQGDHDNVAEELAAIEEYLTKVTAECTVVPETYEETAARRTAEISGLKEALQVLDAPALIQRMVSRRSLRVRRA